MNWSPQPRRRLRRAHEHLARQDRLRERLGLHRLLATCAGMKRTEIAATSGLAPAELCRLYAEIY